MRTRKKHAVGISFSFSLTLLSHPSNHHGRQRRRRRRQTSEKRHSLFLTLRTYHILFFTSYPLLPVLDGLFSFHLRFFFTHPTRPHAYIQARTHAAVRERRENGLCSMLRRIGKPLIHHRGHHVTSFPAHSFGYTDGRLDDKHRHFRGLDRLCTARTSVECHRSTTRATTTLRLLGWPVVVESQGGEPRERRDQMRGWMDGEVRRVGDGWTVASNRDGGASCHVVGLYYACLGSFMSAFRCSSFSGGGFDLILLL